MRYQTVPSSANYPYPDHNLPVAEKGREFCMSYAKAAFFDWSFVYPKGVFYNNGGDYDKFRLYALGKQPISQYKTWSGVDAQTNKTWLNVDWTVRPIVSRYRDRAISRLMKQTHSIVATPIDMLAKSEQDKYYVEMKAKLAVRQLMQQANPELANHPMISLEPGEPMDVEELEMRVNLGEQFNRSKDAEQAIELGFYDSDLCNRETWRREIFEDLFDYGVGGYKEWLGDDNKAKYRRVDPNAVIVNYCRKANFSDMVHAGEVIDVSLVDLALVKDDDGNQMFSDAELTQFAGSVAGKWGNPNTVGKAIGWYKPFDKFKCKVLDLEFYSYNEYTYSDRTTAAGNTYFTPEESGRGKVDNPRYKRKRIQVVYKVKWIVGTDYCYDFGLAHDMKRSNNAQKRGYTSLSYKFYAYNFYEMKAQGMMERLIPYLDDYQLTILKIQNWKNRAIPSGYWIDLDALENVALNKGGKNMSPREVLDMFCQTGILMGRSKDASGNPMGPNWKPVIPVDNTALSELSTLYNDLISTIQQIEATTGYNAITAGDPSPKTLVPGYETANMSTDDALFPMAFAEQTLCQSLAADILCRMQQGIRKGDIEGAIPYRGALGTNTITFIKVSPSIAMRDYGILIQEKTSDDQRMWLMNQMQRDIDNGMLDTSDAIMIINTHNVKQAQMILAYRVKKAKEIAHQNELQKIQANAQGGAQAAQIAEQSKQQTLAMELQSKERMKMMELQAQVEMKRMEMQVKSAMNTETNATKIETAEISAEAKGQTSNN